MVVAIVPPSATYSYSSIAAAATSTSTSLLSPLLTEETLEGSKKKCQLLGPVGLIVQACMGVFVVLSLVVKRQYEGNVKEGIPRRTWKVWSLDVGKQLIGQAFVHFLNIWVSKIYGMIDKYSQAES